MTPTRLRPTSASCISACRCWASATACSSWCTSWAARCAPPTSASTATPQVELLSSDSPLFKGLHGPLPVWMSHGDEALELPPGFELIGQTSNAVAAIENPAQKYLRRAVPSRSAPHAAGHRDPAQLRLRHLRAQAELDAAAASSTRPSPAFAQTVGNGRVICALSGGVDSSVAAELVHRAIGDQLTCIFVNNGVLRKNEFENVQKNLRDKLGLNIDAVDASERFLDQARRRHRSRERSARSSATSSSRSSRKRRTASSRCTAKSSGWCRARSIPT